MLHRIDSVKSGCYDGRVQLSRVTKSHKIDRVLGLGVSEKLVRNFINQIDLSSVILGQLLETTMEPAPPPISQSLEILQLSYFT